jgi:hypothetical protein
MRVTSVALYSSTLSEAITFSLSNADPSDQYVVRTIIGLDAEEIIPKFYGLGLKTKPRFYEFGLKAREIVIRVVLNPRFNLDEAYSDVRDQLYRTISATRMGVVVLHFNSGATTVCKIEGFITKFEVPYFTELPEAQLTIRCDDPIFRAINPVSYASADLKTTNPVIIPDSLSTAPHGFTMQQTFKASSTTYLIQDDPTQPEWVFKVTPASTFLSGDIINFSSENSNRYIYMVRAGVTTYLMDRIQPGSMWPTMFPGSNSFQFVTLPSLNWNSLEFYPAYWGV